MRNKILTILMVLILCSSIKSFACHPFEGEEYDDGSILVEWISIDDVYCHVGCYVNPDAERFKDNWFGLFSRVKISKYSESVALWIPKRLWEKFFDKWHTQWKRGGIPVAEIFFENARYREALAIAHPKCRRR